jgi:hypothetical protein
MLNLLSNFQSNIKTKQFISKLHKLSQGKSCKDIEKIVSSLGFSLETVGDGWGKWELNFSNHKITAILDDRNGYFFTSNSMVAPRS